MVSSRSGESGIRDQMYSLLKKSSLDSMIFENHCFTSNLSFFKEGWPVDDEDSGENGLSRRISIGFQAGI